VATGRRPRLVLLALVLLAAIQIFHYYPRLPDVVASHFDGAGAPNGWSTRTLFFAIEAGAVALAGLLALGAPWLLRVAPRWVNLPHKAHWLGPGRRAATQAYFDAAFAWFGCALVALLIGVMQLAIRANLGGPPRLNASVMWALLAGFAGFMVVWLVAFLRRFRAPR